MSRSDTAKLLLAHLKDNDGEVVYWGETVILKQFTESRHPGMSVSGVQAKTLIPAKKNFGMTPESVENAGASKAQRLHVLHEDTIGDCHRCPLGDSRIKLVFGVGNPESNVMFVGEGPGFDEDRQGDPFVGKAGQLLDKIIGSIGLNRTNVYIANIVKCHPMVDPAQPDKRGNDRPPTPEEMQECLPFLREQISIINPKVIVTLGATATKGLLNRREGITALRGKLLDFQLDGRSVPIKVLPTFHPAALLRDENLKRPVWEDMKLLKKTLESFITSMI